MFCLKERLAGRRETWPQPPHNFLFSSPAAWDCSGLLVGLNDQGLVDVRDHTTASNGGLDQRVKLLVTADRELQVTRSYSLHLEVLAGVAGELQDLSGKILQDRRRVDGRRGTNATVGADSALQESVDSPDGELFKLSVCVIIINKLTFFKLLPEVQRERISTAGSSCSCPFRTCRPCRLFLLFLRPIFMKKLQAHGEIS